MKSILSPILLQRITRPATNWLAHQVNTGKLIIANWFHPLEYQLAGIPVDNKSLENKTNEAENIFDNFLWFAVPKSKVRKLFSGISLSKSSLNLTFKLHLIIFCPC